MTRLLHLVVLVSLASCQHVAHREPGEAGRPASAQTAVLRDAAVDGASAVAPGASVTRAPREGVRSAPWRAQLLAAKDAFLRGDDLVTVAGLFGRVTVVDGALRVATTETWLKAVGAHVYADNLSVTVWLAASMPTSELVDTFGTYRDYPAIHARDDGDELGFEPILTERGRLEVWASIREAATSPPDGTIEMVEFKWVPAQPTVPTP